MIDLDQDLYDRLMLLLEGSENKDDTLNSLGAEMAWEVMTRLEGCSFIGIEPSATYAKMGRERIRKHAPSLFCREVT